MNGKTRNLEKIYALTSYVDYMEVIGHMQIQFVTLLYLNMNVAANDLPHVKPPGCELCYFCVLQSNIYIYVLEKSLYLVPG